MATRRFRTLAFSVVAFSAAGGVVTGGVSCANGTAGNTVTIPDGAPGDTTTSGDDAMQQQDSPIVSNECDANTQNDYLNCGSCGHRCAVGDTCSCGMCTPPCEGGLTACCGTCVDTTKDPNNCGTCQNECPQPQSGTGTPVCSNSTCTFTCPVDAGGADAAKIIQCGADSGAPGCFDPTSSAQACGGCGKACASGQECLDSMCCAQGSAVCGGQCENVQDSSTNCGACDAGCPSPATCNNGVCTGYGATYPTAPFIDACSLPGHSTVLPNQFDWESTPAFALPINFSFYGSAQTQVFIQTQGAIGFGATNMFMDSYPSCSGFDPTTSYPAIVAFGDDNMGTGPSGVCYALIGEASDGGATPSDAGSPSDAGAPSDAGTTSDGGPTGRQFVVTWEKATYLGETNAVMTFSLVLSEGSNAVDLMYETMADGADGGIDPSLGGANATAGMQNGSGLDTPISCDKQFISATPYVIHLQPL